MLRTSRMYVEHYVSTSCVLYVPEIFKFSNGHFFTHMFTYVRNVRTNGKNRRWRTIWYGASKLH